MTMMKSFVIEHTLN